MFRPGKWRSRFVYTIYGATFLFAVSVGMLTCQLCIVSVYGPYCFYGGEPAAIKAFFGVGPDLRGLARDLFRRVPQEDWVSFSDLLKDAAASYGTSAVDLEADTANPFPLWLGGNRYPYEEYEHLDVIPSDIDKSLIPLLWNKRPFPAGRPLWAPAGSVNVLCLDGTVRIEALSDVRDRVKSLQEGRPVGPWRGRICP